MKKMIALILCTVIAITTAVFPAFAADNQQEQTIYRETVHFQDGSYMVTVLDETTDRSRGAIVTKSGRKSHNYYSSSDVLQWTFTIHGEFSVTPGVKAYCDSAYYTYSIKQSGWSLSTATASRESYRAIGRATFYNSTYAVNQSTTVILSCDVNGNLS